ncbi:MAG: 4,5-DOPA dioxygenase extradiol [Bacteroidetes Order II. Incertae sedis bacterium]|nr:4,5-DOPA dioxygenase extradiol [Bacteroidetes Order II. bacterium]
MRSLQDLASASTHFPRTPPMPLLFLGHGSPMNAIEENEFVVGFRRQAQNLPRPHAILCISAHWLTNGTHLTAMPAPRTIHDVYGFPPTLYEVNYPAPGSPALAAEAQQLLSPSIAQLDMHWGLDHGAWSVLKHLFPAADVPVVQMSIDYHRAPSHHYELAKRLYPLRERGILIVGSGNLVHNLSKVDFSRVNEVGYGYDWAHEARNRINNAMDDEDLDTLLHYERQGHAFRMAIPTPDHYFPLLYCMGLKQKHESAFRFNDQLLAGSLSMTSVRFN